MKWIFIPAFCFFLSMAVQSYSQTDSARYGVYIGSYFITTPNFPVQDVTVYWKDTALAYYVGGSKGFFKHTDGDNFSFSTDDHYGTVTFKRNEQSDVNRLVIFMDGETYEGIKKKSARN